MNNTISYIDRKSGEVVIENPPGGGMLSLLYNSALGLVTLNTLVKRKFVSRFYGFLMERSWSSKLIKGFVEKYSINMSEFIVPVGGYVSFNQFFYRALKVGARKVSKGIVSPADGKVLAFENIDSNFSFHVKGITFNLEDFFQDKTLASKYEGGNMTIIRLAPDDYHRFHFPAKGEVDETVNIKGDYLSVSPLALKSHLKTFSSNKRAYTNLKTNEFGDIGIIEVGSTMVGSIVQTSISSNAVEAGEEKGYFKFGGSTIVLFFEKGKMSVAKDILKNTQMGIETKVSMGESIEHMDNQPF
ncbi:archaetidylserine decarboxylase [Flammeovirga sp. SJP92]|uniref:archaetidylserine decarboxylase n=1 Tax=Flammeovirga sp. SJP92 TaxID=1775430 RepID=UPI000B24C38D|nr:archaetidylserine decarboxylase [Flammeovirga sp. SJP92]